MDDSRPVVSLVVGHSEKEPGAYGKAPINQYEYFYNLEFLKSLASVLSDDFTPQIYFRDGLGIDKTYDELEKIKPFVSLESHFNSSSDARIGGSQTICTLGSYDFALKIQKGLIKALNRSNRQDMGVRVLYGPDDRGWHSVVRLLCPNVLIEPFFGSSPDDCLLMRNCEKEVCQEIRSVLVNWKKISKPTA